MRKFPAVITGLLLLVLIVSACSDVTSPGASRIATPGQSTPSSTAPAPATPTYVIPQIVTVTPSAPATPATSSASVRLGNLTFPTGSVVFAPSSPAGDDRYSVVFDPSQSGTSGRPPMGWWHQPLLPPASQRVAHSVAIVLRPGLYQFTGPECAVWFNTDGQHPAEQGMKIVDRQNVDSLTVPATQGNEAWVFVSCRASEASGFSFSRTQ